jgi:aryl-alcohol dehydrogenase-like predicted oxidoreductase
VESMAVKKGCSMSSVAIAWLLHKNASPKVGLNTIERIEAVSEALTIDLTAEDIHQLEELYSPLEVQSM